MHIAIGFFASSHSLSQPFQENRLFSFQVRVVLKLLVSLIGRLIARTSVDPTDKPTLGAHAHRGLKNVDITVVTNYMLQLPTDAHVH